MDARTLAMKAVLLLSAMASMGATCQTPNFVVDAPTDAIARQVAATAERCRDEVARQWLGHTLPNWYEPCRVTVKVGQIGAGGATTFAFDRGHVFGWRMNVQGSLERILDSVIPHEVTHTILACHFRRPLPRWADEGAATLVEHESERNRQTLMLKQVFNTRRRIPLARLLVIKEYPADMQDVLTLYAQGYSLVDFLVQRGGRARYLAFLEEAHKRGWDVALQTHYKLKNVSTLEKEWEGWVIAGSKQLPEGTQLASASDAVTPKKPNRDIVIFRSQNPSQNAQDDNIQPQATVAAKETTAATATTGIPASPAATRQLAAVDRDPAGVRRSQPRSQTLNADNSKPQRNLNQGWVTSTAAGEAASASAPAVATTPANEITQPRESGGLPRPEPLVLSVPEGFGNLAQGATTARPMAPENAAGIDAPSIEFDSDTPATAPADDSFVAGNFHRYAGTHHPGGEQKLASGRLFHRSDFPQSTTPDGRRPLGEAFSVPVSP